MSHPEQFDPERATAGLEHIDFQPTIEKLREIEKIQEKQTNEAVRNYLLSNGALEVLAYDATDGRLPVDPSEIKMGIDFGAADSPEFELKFSLTSPIGAGPAKAEVNYEIAKNGELFRVPDEGRDGEATALELPREQREDLKGFYKALRKNLA